MAAAPVESQPPLACLSRPARLPCLPRLTCLPTPVNTISAPQFGNSRAALVLPQGGRQTGVDIRHPHLPESLPGLRPMFDYVSTDIPHSEYEVRWLDLPFAVDISSLN